MEIESVPTHPLQLRILCVHHPLAGQLPTVLSYSLFPRTVNTQYSFLWLAKCRAMLFLGPTSPALATRIWYYFEVTGYWECRKTKSYLELRKNKADRSMGAFADRIQCAHGISEHGLAVRCMLVWTLVQLMRAVIAGRGCRVQSGERS